MKKKIFLSLIISTSSYFVNIEANAKGVVDLIEAASTSINISQSATEIKGKFQQKKNLKESCENHYPLGKPIIFHEQKEKIERRAFTLCQSEYAVQYDPATKNPIWVSQVLNGKEQANTFVERKDNFQPNPYVPKDAQAKLNDYKSSKFDRGHMAPAADMLNEKSMEESFYLTNMIPQVGPNMNRGIWADLEAVVRKWSISRGKVIVMSGPIYKGQTQTMGNSKVLIPTHVYKIVVDPNNLESIAFIIPNVQIITRKTKEIDEGNPIYFQTTPKYSYNCGRLCIIDNFIVPVEVVEQVTKINFFPNVNLNKSLKGKMWHIK